MIVLEGVSAPRRRPVLKDVSLAWGPGAHGLIGTPADGGPLLLRVISGEMAPRTGSVRVLESGPTDALGSRAHRARGPRAVAARGASRSRGTGAGGDPRGDPERDPAERLATLGIEALSARRVSSLSTPEVRAVALCEALTSTRVRVVLLEEPFVAVDPRAAARLSGAVRACARDACAVIVSTASLRDAGRAGGRSRDNAGRQRGRASRVAGTSRRLCSAAGTNADLTSAPQALLAEQPASRPSKRWRGATGAIFARGANGLALAQAVGRAVLASGADVWEMRLEPPTIEEARAASAGIATATYEAAYTRTRAALGRPPAADAEGAP